MEIFNSKGKNLTKSDVLLVTKPIGSLIVSSSLDFDALTNEQIEIFVERISGNVPVTNGLMFLKDFLLLTTFNGDALTSDAVYKLTAECEIAEDGAIALSEKDVIKIRLANLKGNETYVLNTIEMPQLSPKEPLRFDNRSMNADERQKSFDIYDCDLALLDDSETIEEVSYTFLNDVVVRYTMHELRVLSRGVDPVAYVKQDGTVKSTLLNKLQLPLFGVKAIEIRKTQSQIVNLITRIEA
ncbi:hypothetical protein [Flavobacterium sp.]|uniref:hypothetical protein n=1 Tax=Flavobacterium sp. TaxID=239 RepID=UPI002627B966|nr:hypothetical protein [Flavobacterium sp.]